MPSPLGAEHLDQRDSEHFVGVTNWVGRRVPHHVAANGKVFLAFGAAPAPARLQRFTQRTITNKAALEAELERVRSQGYATAIDELELGLTAVAAPVRDAGDVVVAALSVSGPTSRLTPERVEQFASLLLNQAASLGRRLDHRDHERGAA